MTETEAERTVTEAVVSELSDKDWGRKKGQSVKL